jgi:putative transposase
MTTRSFKFAPAEFYHVYNRGVEKRIIYETADDYKRFVELLYLANGTNSVDIREIQKENDSTYDWDKGDALVAIGAYCLMPNHFHILLSPLHDDGVAKFMNKLCTSYSMYFNQKYNRKGTLYEGKFKAKWIDSDNYLKYLYAYIHLNPVKLIQSDWKERGINDIDVAYKYVLEYEFSSLPDYVDSRPSTKILNPNIFPDYFSTATAHKRELVEWLKWEKIQIKI